MSFLSTLDAQIQAKHLLNHPFYRAWSQGILSKQCLQGYAKEYYHHVLAFPTYLSALHAHTEDTATRKALLQNLVEEEGGSPNHPDLWRRFILSLGCTEEEIDSHIPSLSIQKLIADFRAVCREGTVAEGIASLYAYESQIPEICVSKIDGLKKFYGLSDVEAWRYFAVHIAADKEHARVERELLEMHVVAAQEKGVESAVQRTLDNLWDFLSDIARRYEVAGCVMAS